MTKAGRLFGSVYWWLNKDASNLPIIFQNVVIRFNALDEKIYFRTEFSDYANMLYACKNAMCMYIFIYIYMHIAKR